ncbi:GIN domain-containing protein [Flavobacterium sp.]|uniref:GIN domain-containing protein n=1 Tax=Flavobacterium sp. TaxID=239 RepID=UPI00286C9336|nr:DUF2807 domain-containing protein [Flavobacterium sp.]
MKKIIGLVTFFLFTSLVFAQQKEKVKGSKIVTIVQKDITEFEELEVADNLEIFLIKGDKCALEIEADDNLQEFVSINAKGKVLHLASTRQVSGAKKFSIRVTYTDDFKLLMAKDDANVTALAELNIPNFTFKIHDNAKIYANVNAKTFTLMSDDKSKAELNLKSEDATIEMSKNSQLKALIASTQMKFDMYQKTKAVIEGDVIDFKLRLDNDADFTGNKLTTKNTELLAEASSECSINVATKLVLDAKGKAEIKLYGNQKIEIKNFLDSAVLSKKTLK